MNEEQIEKKKIVLYIEWKDEEIDEFEIKRLKYRYKPFQTQVDIDKYYNEFNGYQCNNTYIGVKKIELYFATKKVMRVFYNNGTVYTTCLKNFYSFSYIL